MSCRDLPPALRMAKKVPRPDAEKESLVNTTRFDSLVRRAANVLSRREAVAFATSGLAGSLSITPVASRKRHRRRRSKKKVTFNDFGCVNVGSFCTNGG